MSKTKKIISVVLALTLVMTMATVAIVSASAADTIKVYFDGATYGSVYAYVYGGADGEALGAWPGAACTDEGNGIWSAEIPADCSNVIFNNNAGSQTNNLVNPGETMIAKLTGNQVPGDFQMVDEAAWEAYGAPVETTVAETTVVDTTVADTTVADTTVADTTVADTTVADTTVAETTVPDTTEPSDDITVFNADAATVEAGETFTYTAKITAAQLFEDIQAYVQYDADAFELVRVSEDAEVEGAEYCPNLGDSVVLNAAKAGIVKFNSIKLRGFDFTAGAELITLEFKALADADVADIDLVIEEMTIKGDGTESYFTGSKQVVTDGIAVAIETSVENTPDVTTTAADTTVAELGGVTVNGETAYIPVGGTFTYVYALQADELFEDIQATVYYDSAVLKLVRPTPIEDEPYICCPHLGDVIFNADKEGQVKFNSIKLRGFDFTTEQTLVTLTFEVIDTKATEVYTVIEEMTIKGDGTESYFTGSEQVKTDGIVLNEFMIYDIPETTVVDTTVVDTTVVDTTVVDTTVVDTTVVDTTVVDTTVVETTVVDTTVVDTTVVDTTVVDTTVVDTTVADTTVADKTEATTVVPDKTEATTAPAAGTDPTSNTEPTKAPADAPITGAAAYVYVVLAVLSIAACAVVVLRKKANG